MHTITVAQWVAALRSGGYPQTKNHLRTDKGFCCLGVACDLAAIPFAMSSSDIYLYTFELDGLITYKGMHLPQSVLVDLDLEARHNGYESKSLVDTIVVMNDRGSTFSEIADLIEKYLPADFIIKLSD